MINYQRPNYANATTRNELIRVVLPGAIANLVYFLLALITRWNSPSPSIFNDTMLHVFSILTILFCAILYFLVFNNSKVFTQATWFFIPSIILFSFLGLLAIPQEYIYISLLGITGLTNGITILWGRNISFITLITLSFLCMGFISLNQITSTQGPINLIIFITMGWVVTESTHQILSSTTNRVNRLEKINQFARKIALSLEPNQVLTLLQSAMQSTLDADTIYVGLVEDDCLKFEMFYDDGEYFPAIKLPIDGTLSGWVIKHQRSLFIPDLRKDLDLEGVALVLIGKNKNSLSWIGVPMITPHTNGILVVASYKPNAFDASDVELLENLAQQAALAMENAFHHTEVEEQSRLDSLTRVFNHGYFLELAYKQAKETLKMNGTLSIIMLDIDFFKQYNDTFGHLVGDDVLKNVTTVIKNHIHAGDVVGRWGGEEFVVLLPGLEGKDAYKVAKRIQNSLLEHPLEDRDGNLLTMPTISQGIAIFPQDTDDVIKLIDLADQRLYKAKERGRNQIEPNETEL